MPSILLIPQISVFTHTYSSYPPFQPIDILLVWEKNTICILRRSLQIVMGTGGGTHRNIKYLTGRFVLIWQVREGFSEEV